MAEIWGAALGVAAAGANLYASNQNAKTQRSSSGTSGFCACVQAGTKQAIQTAEGVANQPFQGYCVNNAVAGLSGNQVLAQQEAQARAGCLGQLNQTAGQQFNAQTLSQYENPYVTQVLGAQNALASKNYQTQMACLENKQGMTSAFGGDRSAIAQGQLTQNYNLNTNLNNATGLSNAYTQGVSAFNQNRAYASGEIGQIGGALSATGAVCQATNQNRANFNYNQFCQQRNWTKNQNAYLTQTLAQVPKGQYYTGNQTSTTIPAGGGWGGALAGGLQMLNNQYGGGGGTTGSVAGNLSATDQAQMNSNNAGFVSDANNNLQDVGLCPGALDNGSLPAVNIGC
jgi:hypothetical protein